MASQHEEELHVCGQVAVVEARPDATAYAAMEPFESRPACGNVGSPDAVVKKHRAVAEPAFVQQFELDAVIARQGLPCRLPR